MEEGREVGRYVAKGKPSWEPKALLPWHYTVLTGYANGAKIKDLSREFGVSTSTVKSVVHSELGVEYINELIESARLRGISARERIEALQIPAVEYLGDTLKHPDVDDSVKSTNARFLLSAGGNGVASKRDAGMGVTMSDIKRITAEVLDEHKRGISGPGIGEEVAEAEVIEREESGEGDTSGDADRG